jgi:predicted PurR-regulated permease PerM
VDEKLDVVKKSQTEEDLEGCVEVLQSMIPYASSHLLSSSPFRLSLPLLPLFLFFLFLTRQKVDEKLEVVKKNQAEEGLEGCMEVLQSMIAYASSFFRFPLSPSPSPFPFLFSLSTFSQ